VRALPVLAVVLAALALTPASAPAARKCGWVRNHPRGLDNTYGNHILSFRVPCSKARAIVRGWLGRRSSYATTTSRYHRYRFIFRDPEDYLATRGGKWIIFQLSATKES